MAGLERRVHAIAPVRGSTCGTLRYAPLFHLKAAAVVRPLGAPPAPKLRTCGQREKEVGGGAHAPAPRLRTRPGHDAVPPPAAIPRVYWYEQSSDRGGRQ